MINKSVAEFIQVHNFKFLFKVAMLFYVVGNIENGKLVCDIRSVFPPVPKHSAFVINKSVVEFIQVHNFKFLFKVAMLFYIFRFC